MDLQRLKGIVVVVELATGKIHIFAAKAVLFISMVVLSWIIKGTIMRGLYAAGECACVPVHGANRLGTNKPA